MRFTVVLALAADCSTLAVPFSAGSIRSSCGLEVSMKKGDLRAVCHGQWMLMQKMLPSFCRRGRS